MPSKPFAPTRMMKSLVPLRLSGTHGFCILVQPNKPVPIPGPVQDQARAAGMQDLGPFEDTNASKTQETVDQNTGSSDNTEADEAAFRAALDKALTVIIMRNDEDDLKSDNTPKLQRVIAELPPEVRKPTATEVSDAYARLQENIDLAE